MCRCDIVGAGSFCNDHQIEFDHRWDHSDADPIEDLYEAMKVFSPTDEAKKYWEQKISQHKKQKTQ